MDAVARNRVETANIPLKDKTLLAYVKKLTLEPAKIQDADVQRMRDAGWTDEEIYEATFDTALFAFFNRMADAYGLDYPSQGWHPPTDDSSKSAETEKPAKQAVR